MQGSPRAPCGDELLSSHKPPSDLDHTWNFEQDGLRSERSKEPIFQNTISFAIMKEKLEPFLCSSEFNMLQQDRNIFQLRHLGGSSLESDH